MELCYQISLKILWYQFAISVLDFTMSKIPLRYINQANLIPISACKYQKLQITNFVTPICIPIQNKTELKILIYEQVESLGKCIVIKILDQCKLICKLSSQERSIMIYQNIDTFIRFIKKVPRQKRRKSERN